MDIQGPNTQNSFVFCNINKIKKLEWNIHTFILTKLLVNKLKNGQKDCLDRSNVIFATIMCFSEHFRPKMQNKKGLISFGTYCICNLSSQHCHKCESRHFLGSKAQMYNDFMLLVSTIYYNL